jgi:ligand-binding sensor domain-containing protein
MVLLAISVVAGIIVWSSTSNLFAQEPASSSPVRQSHAGALQRTIEGPPSTPASLTKLRFSHLSVADGLSNADVRAIVQDQQGFMWFGTWLGGLNRYDGSTFKVYRHDDRDDGSLRSDSIWALYLDRAGTLWVGLDGGVDRYDRDTDSFLHYRYRADDPTGMPGSQGMAFLEDESGTLWVGTSGGLGRFDRTSGRFLNYRRTPNDPPSIGHIELRALCLDAATGLLWVGTLSPLSLDENRIPSCLRDAFLSVPG